MGFFTKHFTNDMIPDQSGKIAVVTGSNTGLGYHVALQLARTGCRVYLACRSEERATDAMARIRQDLAQLTDNDDYKPDIHFLHLDLNSLKNVDEAADKLLTLESKIDILINNAAIMTTPYGLSVDGIEGQFAVNHVGPYHFTQRLIPAVCAAGSPERPARIIFTSSIGHNLVPKCGVELTLDGINNPATYKPISAYGRTKLANILTAKYYADQFKKESDAKNEPLSILVNAVHPGSVRSELTRHTRTTFGPFIDVLFKIYYFFAGISPADGALSTLYAATSEEIQSKQYNGEYFVPYGKLKIPSELARSEKLRDDVWNFTQELIAEKLPK
ncbi:hypothetical protein BDF19DRAFT_440132 [Syncephalis fuscata]|nr:hypothetical protein BDF19DRAFT_440132 [Syncephalis fuscata]